MARREELSTVSSTVILRLLESYAAEITVATKHNLVVSVDMMSERVEVLKAELRARQEGNDTFDLIHDKTVNNRRVG